MTMLSVIAAALICERRHWPFWTVVGVIGTILFVIRLLAKLQEQWK